ncbi:MAG: HAD-IC family P-type ATPase [Spirochaetales bacterium]|nr:HAD-IC family P-type ATPase [Spirochaetales bacterium]
METKESTLEDLLWHAEPPENVLNHFGSRAEGLKPEEAEELRKRYGRNILHTEQGTSPLVIILKQLKSPLIYLLAAAAAVSLVTSHVADALVIIVVIILNTILGFIQEYRAEEALKSLKKMTQPRARVIRENTLQWIAAADLVPGDLLVLETGDRVAADARIIHCTDLEVDEAILTGESEPVVKTTEAVEEKAALGDRVNMVWASTSVTAGRGRAVVTATGMESQLGRIAGQVSEAGDETTPLQKRMSKLGMYLGLAGVGFAALVFLIGILTGYELFEMLLFSVAVAVSAIPEGLPAVISVTLALGVKRMAARKAVIRSLPAVETLGSTTVICTDKTGTITRNEMTVTRISAGKGDYTVSGDGYSPDGTVEPAGEEEDRQALDLLLRIGVLANNARLLKEGDDPVLEGSPTEKAILASAAKGLKGGLASLDRVRRISEIPFSSGTKYIAALAEEDGGRTLYVKGAPDRVLGFCSHVYEGGERKELDKETRRFIEKKNEEMASGALRVIAGACKSLRTRNGAERKDAEEGLTFVGLWGIIDPPREDAIEAIRRAKAAGIRVVMITGDHAVTASAIARQTGIAPEGAEAVTGPRIDEMDDEALVRAALDIGVFARVSPDHKLKILKALRGHGEVVSMTGDGVNDAPALKGADIGVAMGITGTEVSKGASDMVLMDDNFATIVHAVEEGRGIYNNLRRVIFFLLATNLGEILTLAAGLLLRLPLPLTAIMVLWINLVTDGACTIPLGVEPRHQNVLKEPPRNPEEPVITGAILFRLVILSVVMTLGTILMYRYELAAGSLPHARTMAFTILAVFQWFQAFNARSSRESVFTVGFFANPALLIGVGIAAVLQVLVIHTPLGEKIFGTAPLTGLDWLLIIGVCASITVADELIKLIGRLKREKQRESR